MQATKFIGRGTDHYGKPVDTLKNQSNFQHMGICCDFPRLRNPEILSKS